MGSLAVALAVLHNGMRHVADDRSDLRHSAAASEEGIALVVQMTTMNTDFERWIGHSIPWGPTEQVVLLVVLVVLALAAIAWAAVRFMLREPPAESHGSARVCRRCGYPLPKEPPFKCPECGTLP